jgi:hypothetical protein
MKHRCLLEALLVITRRIHTLRTILALALLALLLIIATKDSVTQKESRLRQATLLKSVLAFGNKETGKRTLNKSLKETLIRTRLDPKKSLRP